MAALQVGGCRAAMDWAMARGCRMAVCRVALECWAGLECRETLA